MFLCTQHQGIHALSRFPGSASEDVPPRQRKAGILARIDTHPALPIKGATDRSRAEATARGAWP